MVKRFSTAAAALLAVLVLATGASVAGSFHHGWVGMFSLQGTNGYTITGLITPLEEGDEGMLWLTVRKGDDGVGYIAKGQVTGSHVQFGLGALGWIDAEVLPTGATETLRTCSGRSIAMPAREYVGTIDFRGEEGFTEANESNAPLLEQRVLEVPCGKEPYGDLDTLIGGPAPRLLLRAHSKEGPRLELGQNGPGGPISYVADDSELEGQVEVHRVAQGKLPGSALTVSTAFDSAHFAPVGPFEGQATYEGPGSPTEKELVYGTWIGDLSINFPGRADVQLAGSPFGASIVLHASPR